MTEAQGEAVRLANTQTLINLMRESWTLGYNRAPSPEAMEGVLRRLDPNGTHVLTIVIFMHNDAEHHRVLVQQKIKGSAEPEEALLDVNMTSWSHLVTYDHYMGAK